MAIESESQPTVDAELLHRGRIALQRTSDVVPAPVRYVAPGVPESTVTLFAGEVGIGKSLLTIDIAARLSRGEQSGDLLGTPTPLVLVGNEDALAPVVVPRLMAARADRTVVYHTTDVELPADTADLVDLAVFLEAKAIIFDPLTAIFAPGVDLHREDGVRPALTPLVDTLADTEIAAIGVVHTRKSREGSSIDRVLGARAFAAVARSIFSVEAVPEDEDPTGSVRVIRHIKSNVSALLHDRAFRILPASVTGWSGEAIWTARLEEVAEVPHLGSSSSSTKLSWATRRVLEAVPDHPTPLREIADRVAEQGKGLRHKTILDSLEQLVELDLVDETGEGDDRVWWRTEQGTQLHGVQGVLG
jgi:hypothetical protein